MLLLFLSTSSFAQLSNGIYAVFDTSMGGITARLDYVKAPMTVANFIGLAEGTQTWYDENEGVPRNDPFYNGTIVNRIAALDRYGTRIVQTGSRNGTNSGGGPGYTFRDEFDDSLRHDRPGVISMANSGKNSNGSQYFFSLGPLPHLDDVHSVFGEVISGLNVLTNISEVPLTNSKPETDVVFDQINILRVGQDASNFVITGHGLPVVTSLPVRISSASTNMVVLNCQPHQNSLFGFSLSTTLSRWFLVKTVWDTDVRVATNWYLDPTWKLCFCSGIRVDYPDRIYTPSTGHGYHYSASEKIFDVYLDVDSNTGTVYLSPETETNIISSWSWVPDAFRSVLCIDCDNTNYPHCELKLNFTNSYLNDYLFVEYGRERTNSISGTFTYERFAP